MVGSILTNNGAMTALQSLKATQKNLQTTQDRISTGLKVANAKDNAATWAVATAMRSDIATFKQVSENLSVSSGAVSTARSGTEQITSLISEIRTQVTAVQNGVSSADDVQTAIDELVNQIKNVVDSSVFKGLNLLNNTSGAQNVLASVTQSGGAATPTYINVANQDLTVSTTGGLKDLNNFKVADVVSKIDVAIAGNVVNGDVYKFDYKDATGATQSVNVNIAASGDGSKIATALGTALTGAGVTGVTASFASGKLTIDAGSSGVTFGTSALSFVSGATVTPPTGTIGISAATASDTDSNSTNDTLAVTLDGTATYATGDTYKIAWTGTQAGNVQVAIGEVVNGVTVTDKDTLGAALAYKIGQTTGTTTLSATYSAGSLTISATDDSKATLDDTSGTGYVFTAATQSPVTGTSQLGAVTDNSTQTLQNYQGLLAKLDSAAKVATSAGAAFGSAGKRIDLQKDFMDKLVDTLTSGVGAMVDADMNEEAARLQALQVQQQLGTQALSIANQAPQSILSLFRS